MDYSAFKSLFFYVLVQEYFCEDLTINLFQYKSIVKTFYGRNYFRLILSKSFGCNQSHPPLSNIFGQG
jgi:hypothetical protein